jgi:FdrA protein
MAVEYVQAVKGRYADSVTLLEVSRQVGSGPGVRAAMIAMATELNLELASGMGFIAPDPVGPNDLLVAIRADDDAAIAAALAAMEIALTRKPSTSSGDSAQFPPRTVGAAVVRAGTGLALISVPGRFAFTEAMDALDAGCDVLIFSDNVPVEQEIALKDVAAERGLLVMGPDCGTAVVAGVGLGFANVVQPGSVGIVAASGTGAQQLLCLLDAAGIGISACLGLGGRDLSVDVGGRSAFAALEALDADPGTELIVVVSKPPARAVAAAVRAYAATLRTPVLFGLIGPSQPDLGALAEQVVASLERPPMVWPRWGSRQTAGTGPFLRGLYSGGTLCDEAMVIASGAVGEVYSNIALRPEWALGPDLAHPGHLMIDFGDDALTAGRPHPMIDPSLRLERLAREAADPSCGVILMDVVLGHGAHPDPANELATAIENAKSKAQSAGRKLAIVIALIGSTGDPQGLERQATALSTAGAEIFAANADATRRAVDLLGTANGVQA